MYVYSLNSVVRAMYGQGDERTRISLTALLYKNRLFLLTTVTNLYAYFSSNNPFIFLFD